MPQGKPNTTAWNPDDIASRPIGCWQYYRNGVIVPITEDEARHNFDRWQIRSDERGCATFMLKQLWSEIDLLREELAWANGRVIHLEAELHGMGECPVEGSGNG